jgi:hypothetical protein
MAAYYNEFDPYAAECKKAQIGLANTVKAMWPTPQHREKGGGEYADPEKALTRMTSGHQVNLQDTVKALSATPTAALADKAIRTPEGALTEVERGRSPDLAAQACALWVTPTSTDAKRGVLPPRPHDTGVPLTQQVGAITNGSLEQTAKPGGLNPEFCSWLMGYPVEWLFAAPANKPTAKKTKSTGTAAWARSKASATRSSRKSAPPSSPPTLIVLD